MNPQGSRTFIGQVLSVLLAVAGVAGLLILPVGAHSDAKEQTRRELEMPQKWVEFLQLTYAQRQEAKPIQENKVRRIQQVLTAEQNQRLLEVAHRTNVTKYDLVVGLKLTLTQEARYRAIQEETQQQEREVEQNHTLSNEARRQLTINIAWENARSYFKMLTPEQVLRLSELHNKMRQQLTGVLLTPNQQKRNAELNKKYEERIHRLHGDESLSNAARENRLRQLAQWGDAQFQQILTPEQRVQFQQHRRQTQAINESGYYGMPLLEQLGDLTPDQRGQIKTITNETDRQFKQILTPEQKRKYERMTQKL